MLTSLIPAISPKEQQRRRQARAAAKAAGRIPGNSYARKPSPNHPWAGTGIDRPTFKSLKNRSKKKPADRSALGGERQKQSAGVSETALTSRTSLRSSGTSANSIHKHPPNRKGCYVGKCCICGCTEADCTACAERTEQPCYWIMEKTADLCSACYAALLLLFEEGPLLAAVIKRKTADLSFIESLPLSVAGKRIVGRIGTGPAYSAGELALSERRKAGAA